MHANAKQLDLQGRLGLSVALVLVLALSAALWGHGPVGKALIAAAGLLWLAAVWTTGPLNSKRLGLLRAFLLLGGLVCLLATAWGRTIFAILAVLVLISKFRRRRRGRPTKVQAPNLTGMIEYGSTNISATLVQEFTADWRSELSWVMTDRDGRFELPQVSPGATHCLMFSRPDADQLRLEVTIAPEAPPLVVSLRLRSVYPRTLQ